MSVIMLSAVLLGMAATASTAGFFSRFNLLDREYKKERAWFPTHALVLSFLTSHKITPMRPLCRFSAARHRYLHYTIDNHSWRASASSRTVLITTSAKYQEAFSAVRYKPRLQTPPALLHPQIP